MITGNVPDFMVIGARTNFLAAISDTPKNWQRVASVVNLTANYAPLVDLGAAPMPVEAMGRREHQDFIEKALTVKPKNWEITVGISWNTVQDDQTGTINQKVRAAGENFQLDMEKKTMYALANGTSTTDPYHAGYDNLALFSASHLDSGAHNTTAQSNTNSLALTPDNFNTVRAAGRNLLNDQSLPFDYSHNLLLVNPNDERNAAQISNNPWRAGSGDRTINPYQGMVKYVTSPFLTSGQWFLVDEDRSVKPLLMVIREQPNLQSAWFVPDAADGGYYYFKFYARYDVWPGLWPLVLKGN